MRISWNTWPDHDPNAACLIFTDDTDSNTVRESMSPERIHDYAKQLYEIANQVEKRLNRHKVLTLIKNHVKADRRIDAIKELRALCEITLLDAKDIVEMMLAFKNGKV